MKEVRTTQTSIQTSSIEIEERMPHEIIYADDIDFVERYYTDVDEVQQLFSSHNLKVNTEKTEKILLKRKEEGWKSSKKVGSLIGDKEDIEYRKQLSRLADKHMDQG